MGATKEMYMAEVEACGDEFAAGEITEREFRVRMARLGFDAGEIDDQLEALTS